jgi:hypothetical protein
VSARPLALERAATASAQGLAPERATTASVRCLGMSAEAPAASVDPAVVDGVVEASDGGRGSGGQRRSGAPSRWLCPPSPLLPGALLHGGDGEDALVPQTSIAPQRLCSPATVESPTPGARWMRIQDAGDRIQRDGTVLRRQEKQGRCVLLRAGSTTAATTTGAPRRGYSDGELEVRGDNELEPWPPPLPPALLLPRRAWSSLSSPLLGLPPLLAAGVEQQQPPWGPRMVVSREYASPGEMKEKRRRQDFPVILKETATGGKLEKSGDFFQSPGADSLRHHTYATEEFWLVHCWVPFALVTSQRYDGAYEPDMPRGTGLGTRTTVLVFPVRTLSRETASTKLRMCLVRL